MLYSYVFQLRNSGCRNTNMKYIMWLIWSVNLITNWIVNNRAIKLIIGVSYCRRFLKQDRERWPQQTHTVSGKLACWISDRPTTVCVRPPFHKRFHIKSVCDGQPYAKQFLLGTVCDGHPNTDDVMQKIMCDVQYKRKRIFGISYVGC